MLSVIYAKCHIQALNAECRYAECCYAECRYSECRYAGCDYAECHSACLPAAQPLSFSPLSIFIYLYLPLKETPATYNNFPKVTHILKLLRIND